MNRYRIVTQLNDGAPNISSVLIGEDEVEEQLAAEALLHQLAGWEVTVGERTLTCRRDDLVRIVTVRLSDWANDTR